MFQRARVQAHTPSQIVFYGQSFARTGRWHALSELVCRILEACAVKMFRSSLGPNQSDASLCMKKYDHAKKATLAQFLKQYGA